MAAFIVFVIALVFAYLVIWLPFISNLNKEVSIKWCNVFVDLENEGNVDHHTYRGDTQDTENIGVPAASKLLLEEVKERMIIFGFI